MRTGSNYQNTSLVQLINDNVGSGISILSSEKMCYFLDSFMPKRWVGKLGREYQSPSLGGAPARRKDRLDRRRRCAIGGFLVDFPHKNMVSYREALMGMLIRRKHNFWYFYPPHVRVQKLADFVSFISF